MVINTLLKLILARLLTRHGFLLKDFLLLTTALMIVTYLPSNDSLALLLFILFDAAVSTIDGLINVLPTRDFPASVHSLNINFTATVDQLNTTMDANLLP